MGKAALEGRPGVAEVTSGWRGWREINTVRYDPGVITVKEMVLLLREAGTYRGTADPPEPESRPR